MSKRTAVELPYDLTVLCQDPVRIDAKKNLEVQWRTDRRNLRQCKQRHKNTVDYVRGANERIDR